MNIRRGEVHEVVSFYSFLQVPVGRVRVCTGPVCDCFGARELLARTPGAIEVACLGHCDLAPVLTRGDEIVPAVTHATNDGPAIGLGQADETLADYAARGGLELLRDLPPPRRIVGELKAPGSPATAAPASRRREVGGRRARAGAALRRRQRGRGRAGDDQGSLRDGAPAAPHPRGDADRDALRRGDRGLHLPARGVRDGARAARWRRSPSSAPPGCSTGFARARDRRRRVHRRRGDGDARVDGGPARDAAAQAAVPEPGRLPRPADADQQRRDARAHPGDPPKRRRVVGGAGHAGRDGTRLWSVSGAVARPGCYEAPNGITTRELVDEYAGGFTERSAPSSREARRAGSSRPRRSTRR